MKTNVIIFLILITCSVKGQDAFVPFKKSEGAKKTLDYKEYMDGMNQLIDFNGAIQIYHKGEIKLNYFKGLESEVSKKSISASSRFAIASLTKVFTSMMILKLEDQGKIDLNKTISDYLSYYPKSIGEKIKIIDLLNNRSGLPDYTARYDEVSQSNLSVKDFIVEFCTEKPRFESGAEYEYSNSGFYVLGGIIEEITGQPFNEVIEKEIMKKVGMSNSGSFKRQRDYDYDLVDGHENMVKTKAFNPITVYSAGNVYSTVEDMVKWFKAIMDYKLLSKSRVDEMFSGKPIQYYKGWSYQVIQGQLAFGHSGGITGFNTQMIAIPDEDLFVIILANNSVLPLNNLVKDLAAIAIGKEVEIPLKKVSMEVPPMILKKFIGTYEHESGNSLKIGEENGKLFLYLFGSKRSLFAESMNKFYMDQFGPVLEMSFEGGDLKWHQDGNTYSYKKINSDAPSFKNVLTLTAGEIHKLEGTYTTGKSTIKITWKSNQLIFNKDDDDEKNLVQKEDWSFYYNATENGYSFKYPVEFKEEVGVVSMIFDGNIPYKKQ
jgi:CubicO group peptidase (beta-lactamase class C family)